jgi:outer membrane protein
MEMSMKRALICAVFLTFAAGRAAYAEDIKLGYVDLQRAIGETEEGRKARADIKKVFDQKQKELDEQQEALRKQMEDLDKKRTLLPPDKIREKETEIQAGLQKVQGTYLRHQQDIQAKEQEAMSKILDRMNRIIAKIAAAENFTLVLERNQAGLVFAKPHLDLTNELIRRYNAGEGGDGGGGKKPAPPPAAKPPASKK